MFDNDPHTNYKKTPKKNKYMNTSQRYDTKGLIYK